jgi:hypothetical protein
MGAGYLLRLTLQKMKFEVEESLDFSERMQV